MKAAFSSARWAVVVTALDGRRVLAGRYCWPAVGEEPEIKTFSTRRAARRARAEGHFTRAAVARVRVTVEEV